RNLCRDYSAQRVRQRSPRWIQDGSVIEAGCARWRRRTAKTLPSIQRDVMMVAPCGQKNRTVPKPLSHLETEHTRVEAQRTFKISHFYMDVSNASLRIDRS